MTREEINKKIYDLCKELGNLKEENEIRENIKQQEKLIHLYYELEK